MKEKLTMRTPISVGDSLAAYGIHAFGGLFVAGGVCVLAKKTQDHFFPNKEPDLSNYFATRMGFLAGIASSTWIAASPLAQKLATDALISTLIGPLVTNSIGEAPLQLFSDRVGPQFSSLSSFFCGVAGTALSCWAFHKLSR